MVERVTRVAWAFVVGALMVLTASPVWARPAFGEKRANKRAIRMQRKLQKARRRMLRRRVGLDEAKALKVEAIFKAAAAERKTLQSDVRVARRTLAKLLKSNSDDQAAYKSALDGLQRSQKALDALRDKQHAALAKELTPKQQAKLLKVLAKLRKKVDQMRRRGGRKGPRRKRRKLKNPGF